MSYEEKHTAQGLRFLWTFCTAIATRNRSNLISAKAVQIPLFSFCCLGLISGYPKGKRYDFLEKMRTLSNRHLRLHQNIQILPFCSSAREAPFFSKQKSHISKQNRILGLKKKMNYYMFIWVLKGKLRVSSEYFPINKKFNNITWPFLHLSFHCCHSNMKLPFLTSRGMGASVDAVKHH